MKFHFFPALAALLLLSGCSIFSNREVSVCDKSPSEMREYFRNEFINQDGLSMESENFLKGNLLMGELGKDPALVLRKLDEFYALSGEPKYLDIAADICRFLGASASIDKSIPFRLSALHYCRLSCIAHKAYGAGESAKDVSYLSLLMDYNDAVCGIFAYLNENNLIDHDSFSLEGLNGWKFNFKLPEYRLCVPRDHVSDFSLCSSYEVKALMLNNRRVGLGVPLVGKLKGHTYSDALMTPNGLTFPTTLLAKMTEPEGGGQKNEYDVQLVFQDTSRRETIELGGGAMPEGIWPLALDFSTPLACFLNAIPEKNLISSMLHADLEEKNTGLFLIEPYQEDKIPVIFIHGLMSSPSTWVQMMNSLKSDAEIRRRYQFWFYLYSSGTPVIANAAGLRKALLEAQKEFCTSDVARANFEKSVIIGHSMGGLVARVLLQKDEDYLIDNLSQGLWKQVIVQMDEDYRKEVEGILLTPPIPFVHRAVFMAVPHRGADMAKWYLARFGSRLTSLPVSLLSKVGRMQEICRKLGANPSGIAEMQGRFYTGLDNLDPDSPFIEVLQNSPMKEDLAYHCIMGNNKEEGRPGGTDGVVPYSSSHLDGAYSELIVKSDHSVHRTPAAIKEVMRILLENLQESK